MIDDTDTNKKMFDAFNKLSEDSSALSESEKKTLEKEFQNNFKETYPILAGNLNKVENFLKDPESEDRLNGLQAFFESLSSDLNIPQGNTFGPEERGFFYSLVLSIPLHKFFEENPDITEEKINHCVALIEGLTEKLNQENNERMKKIPPTTLLQSAFLKCKNEEERQAAIKLFKEQSGFSDERINQEIKKAEDFMNRADINTLKDNDSAIEKSGYFLAGLTYTRGLLEEKSQFYFHPEQQELKKRPELSSHGRKAQADMLKKIKEAKDALEKLPNQSSIAELFEELEKNTNYFFEKNHFLSHAFTHNFLEYCRQWQDKTNTYLREITHDTGSFKKTYLDLSDLTKLEKEVKSDETWEAKSKIIDSIRRLEIHARSYKASYPEDYKVAMKTAATLRRQTMDYFETSNWNTLNNKATFAINLNKTLEASSDTLNKHRGFKMVLASLVKTLGGFLGLDIEKTLEKLKTRSWENAKEVYKTIKDMEQVDIDKDHYSEDNFEPEKRENSTFDTFRN